MNIWNLVQTRGRFRLARVNRIELYFGAEPEAAGVPAQAALAGGVGEGEAAPGIDGRGAYGTTAHVEVGSWGGRARRARRACCRGHQGRATCTVWPPAPVVVDEGKTRSIASRDSILGVLACATVAAAPYWMVVP